MAERFETELELRDPGAIFRETVRVNPIGRDGFVVLLRLELELRSDGRRVDALVDVDGRLLHAGAEPHGALGAEVERLLAGDLGGRLRDLVRERARRGLPRRRGEVLDLLEDLAVATERQSRTFAVTSHQLMETLERALRLFLHLREENEPWLLRHGGPTEELLRAMAPPRPERPPLHQVEPPDDAGPLRPDEPGSIERVAWDRMVRSALDRYEQLGAVEDRALEGVVDSFLLVLGYVVGGTVLPSDGR